MTRIKNQFPLFLVLAIVFAVFSLGLTTSGQAINTSDTPWLEDYIPGQLIVGIQDNLSIPKGDFAAVNESSSPSVFLGVNTLSVKDLTDIEDIVTSVLQENSNLDIELKEYTGPQILLLELDSSSEEDMRQAIEVLEQNPLVSHASPNYVISSSSKTPTIPNDPFYPIQWGLDKIMAPEAWDIWTGSNYDAEVCQVKVGILDSGIDYTHLDLSANTKSTWGYDFINDKKDAMDDFWHGTHVAGTIGALGNNLEGVAGVCWNVTMIPLKVLDSDGNGTWEAFIEAMVYAEIWNIPILNASLRGYGYDPNVEAVISSYSGLLIAAAGNESNDNDSYPAYPASYDLPNIISVASSDCNDELSYFSNFGETSVDLAAPGEAILSTVPDWFDPWWQVKFDTYYDFSDGTSMATPHVTGTAALLMSYAAVNQNRIMTPAEIKEAILNNVDHSSYLEGLMVTEGRLNTYEALMSIIDDQPVIISNLHFVDLNTISGSVGVAFDLTLNNFEPGTYYMEATLYIYKDIVQDTFSYPFVINTPSSLKLPFLFDGSGGGGGFGNIEYAPGSYYKVMVLIYDDSGPYPELLYEVAYGDNLPPL